MNLSSVLCALTVPRRRLGTVLLPITIIALLIGCSPLVDRDQHTLQPDATIALRSGSRVGQTFVAQHGGLRGVDLWLRPDELPDGEVILNLRGDPASDANLRSVAIGTAQVALEGSTRFDFEPLPESHGSYYYAVLELSTRDGQGSLEVATGPADAYLHGAAYVEHRPQEAQLTFGLVYEPYLVALDLLGALVQWAGWLVGCLFLFFLPGYVLLHSLRGTSRLSLGATLGLSAGIGLSLYALFLIWTDVSHLRLGSLHAWIPVAGGLVGSLLILRKQKPGSLPSLLRLLRGWWSSEALAADVTLLLLLLMVFGARLLVIRTLDAPSWGDSVQHATIVQLMLDNGGLFSSWEPYAPFGTFTVHFGFHSIVAAFAWLMGMPAVKATLVMGQLLNGLAILTLYPLAERLSGGHRWAGVGAVLVGGLLSPMPAYYVNWGRYAQLAGQAILPVALWLLMEVAERRETHHAVVPAGCTLAGATLAYYRMPFYYATFVAVWFVGLLLLRKLWIRDWLRSAVRVASVGGIAIALFLPWGTRLVGGSQLVSSIETGMTWSFGWDAILEEYQVWRGVRSFVPISLLLVGALAVVADVVAGGQAILVVVLWYLFLAMIPAGRIINLPGANMMQSFAIVISLYLPVSLITGSLLPRAVSGVPIGPKLAGRVTAAFVLGLSMLGAISQIAVFDTSYVMVTRPDIITSDWIRANAPSDAVFLVEGFTIYKGRSVVGSDAGWWLPLLAHRSNTMPPQYALLNDQPVDPSYSERVVRLTADLESTSLASSEGVGLLCDMGVTHIFLGQRRGLVGADVRQLYGWDELAAESSFKLVFRRDRAAVFEVDREVCR